jgi:hypothetical protein
MKRNRAGFVLLVEVLFALFVLSLGILAGIQLMRSSVDRGARASADTRAALFATDVFNGLRALSAETGLSLGTNGWQHFWQQLANGYEVPVAALEAWTAPLSVRAGGPHTLVFTSYGYHVGKGTNKITHGALRYRLDVDLWSGPDEATDVRAGVMLKIWDGEFGPTDDRNVQIFYTEYYDAGWL